MSNKNKEGDTIARIVLLERKGGAASQHHSHKYDLTDECDLVLLQDDIRRIIEDPENASKLEMFAPGKVIKNLKEKINEDNRSKN